MQREDRDLEETVEQFLEGRPRAAELAEMRRALQQRLKGLRAALARSQDGAERERLKKEIQTAEQQVAALEREELITEFVEDSVRVTASWSLLKPEEEEKE